MDVIQIDNKNTPDFAEFIKNVSNSLMPEESSIRLDLYDRAIQHYKTLRDTKTDLYEQNDNLKLQIKETEATLENISDILKRQDQLQKTKEKFKAISNQNNYKDITKNIKINRIEKIMNFLKSFNVLLFGNDSNRKYEYNVSKENSIFVAKGIVILTILIILVTIALYFLSNKYTVLIVGGTALIINLISIFLINLIQSFRYFNATNLVSNSIKENQPVFSSYQNDPNEDAYLVNSAWLSAIDEEYEELQQTIQERVGGKNVGQLRDTLEINKEKIKENEERIQNLANLMIKAETYLKIRREYDVLKLDVKNKNNNSEDTPSKSFKISIAEDLDQKLRGTIMSYIEFIKQKYAITIN